MDSRFLYERARRAAAVVGLIALQNAPLVSQDAFEAALGNLPGEVRGVTSAGRWRTLDGEGVYRVIVVRGGYERVADRLYIQWLRNASDSEPPRVVATVGVSQINDAGPFTFSHTLRAEATNRLRIIVSARHSYTRERRQFEFVATVPKIYTDRREPSSTRPKLNQGALSMPSAPQRAFALAISVTEGGSGVRELS